VPTRSPRSPAFRLLSPKTLAGDCGADGRSRGGRSAGALRSPGASRGTRAIWSRLSRCPRAGSECVSTPSSSGGGHGRFRSGGGAPRDRARLAVVHRSHQLGHACDSPLGLARDVRSGENWCTGCRENDLPQRAVASPRLPDFDRADRIGSSGATQRAAPSPSS
jgi:hypothetical protein